MIKKFLQKIFKNIFYSFFIKLYGRIEGSIKISEDNRVKFKSINIDNIFKYNVYEISHGRLYTDTIHDTAVILDNKIIEESSFQLRYKPGSKIYNSNINNNIVFTKGTPRLKKKINGNVLSLLTGGGGNNNYWHWIFDVLPRLGIYEKFGEQNQIDYFLFPDTVKKFQKESLDYLKIPKKKRLSSQKYRHIKTKKLLVTDHPILITGDATYDIQNIPIWIIKWLQKTFISKSESDKKINIYIDRNENKDKSANRFITNENEVKEYLFKNNFIPINLSKTNFIDQVHLFNRAKCVVGLHGAGFANVVFCKPKVKIIELRSSNAGPVIENLAKKSDLDYFSIIDDAQQTDRYKFINQQGSINVSIESLKKILS